MNRKVQEIRAKTLQKGTFVSTVRNDKKIYSKKELMTAESTRELQEKLVWPSSFSLKEYIRTGQILNFPYTEDAIDIVEAAFGPQVFILQGRIIRERKRHVKIFIEQ